MDYYIDYFSELKGKSYKEQYEVLSKAKSVAYEVLKLKRKKYLRTLLILVSCVAVGVIPQVFFELNLLFKTIFFMAAILVGSYFERKNYGQILHQGLNSVLGNDS